MNINGDKTYLHVVVLHPSDAGSFTLLFTEQGNPAVFSDPGHAELFAAKLRDRMDGVRVLQCPVM